MARYGETERFASRLRALRERADYSYETLAQKTSVSRSSLHRYCMGSSVPQDYGTAHRIATVCGATPAELRELHRLWALACTEREERAAPEEARAEETGRAAAAPTDTAKAVPEVGVPRGTSVPRGTEGPQGTPEPPETRETRGVPADLEAEGQDGHENPSDPVDPPAPLVAVGTTQAVPRPTAGRRLLRGRGGRRTAAAAVLTAAALAGAAWGVPEIRSHTRTPAGTASTGQDRRLLFSSGCEPVVSMGQQDTCVREVQRQLERHGASIGVDSSFGPETLRRVTAFQVLAGIAPNGVVAGPTKKALYESGVRMDTWSPKKVRERIRQVFTEAPDDAVAIADCQSFLDPLHILPNTNGTKNWGLFQISDVRLRELGGTPYKALDPEWNIQAAKRLWSQERDFRDWPNCARSLRPSPSADKSPTASSTAR